MVPLKSCQFLYISNTSWSSFSDFFFLKKKDGLVLGHCILSQNIRNFWRTLYVNEVNCVEFIFVCTSLKSWPRVAKVPLHKQEPVLWKSAHISYLKLYSYVELGLFRQSSMINQNYLFSKVVCRNWQTMILLFLSQNTCHYWYQELLREFENDWATFSK